MEIRGTAAITVTCPGETVDPQTLRKIQDELTEKLSAVVDGHFSTYGLRNEQIHSCLIEDLSSE